MQRVEQSILAPAAVITKVIPNGVDLSIFAPSADRVAVRAALKIPKDAAILCFAANGIKRNVWKDFEGLRVAVAVAAKRLASRPLTLFALGDDGPPERIGTASLHFSPYTENPSLMASYYQAADVYVHAARVEVWGLTVTEAMACGCPVIASAVGGVVEQVVDDVTGLLTPPGDSAAMADRIVQVLENRSLQRRLAEAGAERARERFSLERQASSYVEAYHEMIDRFQQERVRPRSALASTEANR